MKHFLTLLDYSPTELNTLINHAIELKKRWRDGHHDHHCQGKVMGMIFEKASTRTRVSFEAGMAQLGGHAIFLTTHDTQLGRGEPIEDSARVLSSMVDIIMIRTFAHATIEKFSQYSSVPVINGLTNEYHPCQLLADMQTYYELRGNIQGKTVVWIGDGNNMCQSYINAARQFDFELRIACPAGFEPQQALCDANKDRVHVFRNPLEAAKDAHLLVTDVWASMGQEEERKQRLQAFNKYQVNHQLLDVAASDALVMHCLPAHRGEEISAELMDDKQAVVWQEAENRLHAQKALLKGLLSS